LAMKGAADREAMARLVSGIVRTDPDPCALYGGYAALMGSARLARRVLEGALMRARPILGYMLGMLVVQPRLARDEAAMAQLAERIRTLEKQIDYFRDPLHPSVIASAASAYEEVISARVRPRIIVRGKAEHLRDPEIRARQRAALLGGVRAAFLWRAWGGSRWILALRRRRLLRALDAVVDRGAAERERR
ncbi:MAG: DUF489 family protein, partial [Zetaproteobacteria bacterium]